MTAPRCDHRSLASAAMLAAAPAAALASDHVCALSAAAVAAVAGRLIRRWERGSPGDDATAWLAVAALGTLLQILVDAVVPAAEARHELPLLALTVALVQHRLAGAPAEARPRGAETAWLLSSLAVLLLARGLAAPGRLPAGLAALSPWGLLLHSGGVLLLAGLLAVVVGGRRERE